MELGWGQRHAWSLCLVLAQPLTHCAVSEDEFAGSDN